MTLICAIPNNDEPPSDDVIEVEPDVWVDLSQNKVFWWDIERTQCRGITWDDVEDWNLFDYYERDEFDEDGKFN